MTENSNATPPRSRPYLRSSLSWVLAFLLLGGSIASLFADTIWLRLTHARCRELFLSDQNQEAINKLRQVVRLDPTNTETLFLLVRGHRRAGDLTRALSILSHLESIEADAERIDLERKLMLVQTGRIRESEANLSSLLMKGGDAGSDALQAFVLGYFANLRTGEALKLLDMWQQSTPSDPQAYFLKAYLRRSLGQIPGAIDEYRKGLELAPNNQLMRERLAECLIENSQVSEARQELNRNDFDREGSTVELLLAKCDYADQDFKGAEKRLNVFLEAQPESVEARTLRGRVLLELNEAARASEDLQAVVDREPTNVLAREALGRALVLLEKKSEANDHFDFVKRATQAQSDITRLIRQSISEPDNVEIRYQIAQLANEYVSIEDGAKWMRTVLELQPTHQGANTALADYYQLRGDMPTSMMYREVASGTKQSE